MEKLIDKQAQLQEKIEAANGWELESELASPWTFCVVRLPIKDERPPEAKSGGMALPPS